MNRASRICALAAALILGVLPVVGSNMDHSRADGRESGRIDVDGTIDTPPPPSEPLTGEFCGTCV